MRAWMLLVRVRFVRVLLPVATSEVRMYRSAIRVKNV